MTNATLADTDVRLRDAVIRQLERDPEVDASAVGVAATRGAVTLTGYIDSYSGKLAAERAAKRVHYVRAVANYVAVRLRLERTDADIIVIELGYPAGEDAPDEISSGGFQLSALSSAIGL